MNSIQAQREKIKNLYNLLSHNPHASIEEVLNAIDSSDKTVPFDPEVSFEGIPENLPVCLAVRAQRFDILQMLVEKYHADVDFSFTMCMIPLVNSMNLIPAPEITNITFANFIVLACCNDYELCSKMLAFVTKNRETIDSCPKKLLLYLTQASINFVDCRVIEAFVKHLKGLPKVCYF